MENVSSLATNDSPVLGSACGIYQPPLSLLLPLFSLLQFPKTIFKVYLTKKRIGTCMYANLNLQEKASCLD